MKTIVVPLDRSARAEQALPMVRTLADRNQAHVVLLSVLDVPREFAAWAEGKSGVDMLIQEQAEDEAYLKEVASTFETGDVETLILAGNPALEIVNLAARFDEPTIVMASHGRTGVRRFILGSVTSRVVHAASCPVLVVRAENEDSPLPTARPVNTVLVPLDGSRFAERALDIGLAALQSQPLHVHLLRVVEPPTRYLSGVSDDEYIDPEPYLEYVNSIHQEAESYLDAVERQLADLGHRVTSAVVYGAPVNQICAAVDERQVDVVVMSTHGRTGIRRFVLGSVAEGVLHHSAAPVVLVSPTAELRDRALSDSSTSLATGWP